MRIACIGSREISAGVRRAVWNIGRLLALAGHDVVSGNARGADQAFASGVNFVDRRKLGLCLPWAGYEQRAIRRGNRVMVAHEGRYRRIAAEHHPSWEELGAGARRLMARNVAIVERADLVIAYPSIHKPWGGGTGFGMELARSHGTSVVDLARADGLDHLLRALHGLPWPHDQDALLEIVWLQRLGGRVDREIYVDRMRAVAAVLLMRLSERSGEQLADDVEQLPASLAWRLLDGRDLRQLAAYDEFDCIDWGESLAGMREDPVRDRVLLPFRPPAGRKPERDPDAPEAELRRIFEYHDTGSPVWDREIASASLHHGDRRWLEGSVAMPSGMVLLRSDAPERWRDPILRHLKRLSWGFFGSGPWELPLPDRERLLRLRSVLRDLELRLDHKVQVIGAIRRELVATVAEGVDGDPEAGRSAVARQVLDRWNARLEGIAAALPVLGATDEHLEIPGSQEVESVVESTGDDIDWSVVEIGVRGRYPRTNEAFIQIAMDRARCTWGEWQQAPALPAPPAEVGGVGKAVAGSGASGYRESFFTGVGHLHRPAAGWEERQPEKVRELLASIRGVESAGELAMLMVEVEAHTGVARRVLEDALRFAEYRVHDLRTRWRARLVGAITRSSSIRWLERARVRHEADPRLTRLVDRRLANLRTLRSGRLTDDLSRLIRWHARLAATEGFTFSRSGCRRAIVARLGKTRDDGLVDRLVDEAEQRFLIQGLTWRVLMATRRHGLVVNQQDVRTHAGGTVATDEVVAAH